MSSSWLPLAAGVGGLALIGVAVTTHTAGSRGIARVPEEWVDALFSVFESRRQLESVSLPLRHFPYGDADALRAIYGASVSVMLNKGVPKGVAAYITAKDEDGGYWLNISPKLKPEQAKSDIRHELRHLVQFLADEVGTFGRSSKAAAAHLKSVAIGDETENADDYYVNRDEWQPWIGTTADAIVADLRKKPPKTTQDMNARILASIKKSKFYNGTDPALRREVLKQVYSEVSRTYTMSAR